MLHVANDAHCPLLPLRAQAQVRKWIQKHADATPVQRSESPRPVQDGLLPPPLPLEAPVPIAVCSVIDSAQPDDVDEAVEVIGAESVRIVCGL